MKHLLSLAVLLLILGPTTVVAKEWYPLEVDVWDPPFNAERQRTQQSYTPLTRASRRWNLCVSIPHLKDAYWLAVNFGLVDEARRLGVNLAIHEAGGYDRLDTQRRQLEECLAEGPDGLIVAAISADGLNDLIEGTHQRGIPVLDLINGIDSPHLSARTAVDFRDMGFETGRYLTRIVAEQRSEGRARAAWFPGPEGAGWVAAGDAGFREALADGGVEIVASRHGDTGIAAQRALVEAVLDELGDNPPDYIAGTAVSAEAAVTVLRKRGLAKQVRVLAYYYAPGVHKGIKRGGILAAPTDSQAIQARMAVDTLVRILEGKRYFKHAAPRVRVTDRANQRRWDATTTLAPRGFRPIFTVRE